MYPFSDEERFSVCNIITTRVSCWGYYWCRWIRKDSNCWIMRAIFFPMLFAFCCFLNYWRVVILTALQTTTVVYFLSVFVPLNVPTDFREVKNTVYILLETISKSTSTSECSRNSLQFVSSLQTSPSGIRLQTTWTNPSAKSHPCLVVVLPNTKIFRYLSRTKIACCSSSKNAPCSISKLRC